MLAASTVRDMADSWSLAGDRKLLRLLENMHQSLMEKCDRANMRLEEMIHALDTASVALHNVNNRFTALGNTQFVESRVYDDDVSVTTSTTETQQDTKKDAVQAAAEELPAVSATLGQYYDEVHIAPDTDSDSDSGQEDSVVLRPKDLYTERPLPHIIGTAAWHNKWHAGLIEVDSDTDSSVDKRKREEDQYSSAGSLGLIEEDSDTDSSVDKREREEDQYSSAGSLGQYEPSDTTYHPTVEKMPDAYSADTVTSEESASHAAAAPPAVVAPAVKPSPSDFAAELARRLGGDVAPPRRSAEQRQRVGDKVTSYLDRGPQPRVTGNIFLDEPPPIDQTVEESEPEDESYDDDIFADLRNTNIFNKNTKTSNLFNKNSNSYGGLFDGLIPEDNKNERDVFDDFADDNKNVVNRKVMKNDDRLFDDNDDLFADVSVIKTANKPIIPSTAPITRGLFDNEEGEEDLFTDNVQPKDAQVTANKEVKHAQTTTITESATRSKKPIGGKSLFGSNQEAERIGAAILKHHQRKASVSSDDNDESYDDSSKVETRSSRTEDRSNMDSTDDDFDDLFAVKSKKSVNPNAKFDDLFAKSIERNKSLESADIFDESAKSSGEINKSDHLRDKSDLDDLFSTSAKSSLETTKVIHRKSDDKKSKPIFNENLLNNEANASQIEEKTVDHKIVKKSIFTDELFDDATKSSDPSTDVNKTEKSVFADDLFDDGDIFTSTMIAKAENPVKKDVMRDLFGDGDDLFAEVKMAKQQEPKNYVKTKSIFDDDSEDDLFAKPVTVPNEKIIPTFVETVTKNNDIKIETDKKPGTLNAKNNGIEENLTETSKNKSYESYKIMEETALKRSIDVSVKPHIGENPIPSEQVNKNEVESQNAIENLTSKVPVEKSPPSVAEKPILKDKPRIIHTKERPIKQKKHNTIVPTEKNTADKGQSETSQKAVLDSTSSTVKKETFDETKIESTGDTNSTENEEEILEFEKRVSKENTNLNLEKSNNDMSNVQDLVDKTPKIQIEVAELEVGQTFHELPNSVPGIPEICQTAKESYESVTKSENPGDDFFNTIFNDQPPVFQRSTEPKKSKNINALFDDDSDDEGLFFKKHDTLSITNSDDAKSIDDFLPPCEDRLFGIFHNDPPDLDVDFAINNNENKDDFKKIGSTEISLETEDLPTIPKVYRNVATNEKDELSAKESTSDEIFEDLEYVKIIRNENGQKRKEVLSPNKTTPPKLTKIKSLESRDLNSERPIPDNLKTTPDFSILCSEKAVENTVDKTTDMQKTNELTSKTVIESNINVENFKKPGECSKPGNENQNDIKPIGKLKPMNLNINIQGLIPGAVPKKPPRPDVKEQSDSIDNISYKTENLETTSSNVMKFDVSQETLPSLVDAIDGAVGSMVKSVSFDKGPESPTLVNTYSKERAKIQVKRRPSTRQARKDAIRKSAHNLNFERDLPIDVTDNFTVSLPTSPGDVTKSVENNLRIDNVETVDTIIHVSKLQDPNVDILFSNSEVFKKHKESEKVGTKNPESDVLQEQNDTKIKDFTKNVKQQTDIVDTRISEVMKKLQKEVKPIQFDSGSSSSEGTSINTLGKVYAARNTTEEPRGHNFSAKQVIFGADVDDIFSFNADDIKGKKEDLLQHKVLTDTIDDLFTSTTKTGNEAERYKAIKPVEKSEVKSLIFEEDESDIHELFNPNVMHSKTGAIRKTIEKDQSTRPITTTTNRDSLETSKPKDVTIETVPEPPKKRSSLFEDDLDDDNLFGGATKPIHTLRETKISNIHEKLQDKDLFLTKKKEDLRQPVMEKKSLFGDDSDDDIFATKNSLKASTAPPPTQQREKEISSQNLTTSAEEVFHDPLSHFD